MDHADFRRRLQALDDPNICRYLPWIYAERKQVCDISSSLSSENKLT
jgi:hypothetical protein